MIVTLSGLPGSGKSTLGEALAKELGLEYFYAGGRTLAKELGMTLEELNARSEKDPTFDRKIDDLQIAKAKAGNVLIDGRISAHMIPGADYKIFLKASLDVRAERISGRDKLPLEETRKRILAREKNERARYQKYYDIDLLDMTVYDLIVDTTKFSPDGTFNIAITAIKEIEGDNK